MEPTTAPSISTVIEELQHAHASGRPSNTKKVSATDVPCEPGARKKSAGALCPHAFTATTRTQAKNPAGRPLALTEVNAPTFAAAYRSDAPGVDPADTI
jgi:hypothetical protein